MRHLIYIIDESALVNVKGRPSPLPSAKNGEVLVKTREIFVPIRIVF
jgi:hypothetical protein